MGSVEKGRVKGPLPCFPLESMLKSPLIRRVSIYLVLSTAAVTGMNLLELDQRSATPIYIPVFIGIYVISRWIDHRLTLRNTNSATDGSDPDPQRNEQQGFKP